jgi:coenzyme F420-0:L-glutamate ligase/coenzyme F420-1:gamma-L-glutamate ligase
VIQVIPVRIAGDIEPGTELGDKIAGALLQNGIALAANDVIVIAQKIVSKAEGRIVNLDKIKPSQKALRLARRLHKDPRIVELILKESREVVKVQNGIIITETKQGLVCANSGVDQSNLANANSAVLLPKDPDASARKLRAVFRKRTGADAAIIITDTFGRPFREGQINVAIGVAGLNPIRSYIGRKDMFGRKLHVTEIAVADELASAAELVMNKSDGVPVAVVKGFEFEIDDTASSKHLIRAKKNDLFRRRKE